jgi:hypothetical protein
MEREESQRMVKDARGKYFWLQSFIRSPRIAGPDGEAP